MIFRFDIISAVVIKKFNHTRQASRLFGGRIFLADRFNIREIRKDLDDL